MRMPCSPTLGCLPSVSSLGCLETLWAPVALRGIEEEQTLGSVGSLHLRRASPAPILASEKHCEAGAVDPIAKIWDW